MRNIIEWETIEQLTQGKRGKALKIVCPNCKDQRSNKRDKALSVNLDKGVAKCHYCDSISYRRDNISSFKKEYTLPAQTWRNYTELSDNLVKYIEQNRKIRQSTLKELGVTQEKYYQPQLGKETDNIVFNYFELDTVVNKKYRDSAKNFTQSKNGKSIFYNVNSIIGQDEVYIVEGEFDVLAMHQAGFKNTVSLPNGANDNDDVWINCKDYVSDVKKFYICTDNDASGEEVSEKIAQRLGRYRCVRVLFEHKDANGELVEKGEEGVRTAVNNAKFYKSQGTFTVDDLYDNIMELHDHGIPKTLYPKSNSFMGLEDAFSVLRGQLVVVTGIPSHGKSTFLEWYVMNLVQDYKMKASFFSPEHHPMELHQSLFIQKFFGRNFWYDMDGLPRITKEEIDIYKQWANEKIYLTSTKDGVFPRWDWLLDVFKEQVFVYGIDIFVIDAFNKLEFDNSNLNELQNIRSTLTKLTMFAQMNNVILFLVAHPKKMVKNDRGMYLMPDLYSISGSADFRNQAHSGFTIYRYFNDYVSNDGDNIQAGQVEFKTKKIKMSYQGEMGKSVMFNYHKPSGRYYTGEEPPVYRLDQNSLSNFDDLIAKQSINNLKNMSIEEAWGKKEEDDLPF